MPNIFEGAPKSLKAGRKKPPDSSRDGRRGYFCGGGAVTFKIILNVWMSRVAYSF
jgi:hypothetical protein